MYYEMFIMKCFFSKLYNTCVCIITYTNTSESCDPLPPLELKHTYIIASFNNWYFNGAWCLFDTIMVLGAHMHGVSV